MLNILLLLVHRAKVLCGEKLEEAKVLNFLSLNFHVIGQYADGVCRGQLPIINNDAVASPYFPVWPVLVAPTFRLVCAPKTH